MWTILGPQLNYPTQSHGPSNKSLLVLKLNTYFLSYMHILKYWTWTTDLSDNIAPLIIKEKRKENAILTPQMQTWASIQKKKKSAKGGIYGTRSLFERPFARVAGWHVQGHWFPLSCFTFHNRLPLERFLIGNWKFHLLNDLKLAI